MNVGLKGVELKDELDSVLYEVLEVRPSKTEEMRARIIETTIEVIATTGIENASFDNIGKKLKMKRSHIAYYFKTRDELIELVLTYITTLTQRITLNLLEDAQTPQEKFKATVGAAFLWATRYPDHVAAYLFYYSMCGREKKYQDRFVEARMVGAQRMQETLANLRGKKDGDLLNIATAVQGFVLGSLFECLAKGQLRDKKYMKKHEQVVTEMAFHLVSLT